MLSFSGVAQYLPVDNGRCEMSDVVLADGFLQGTLFANEVKWLKSLTHEEGKLIDAVKDSLAGKVSSEYEFPVYSQSGIFKKQSGTISYHITVESKDGKYRYLFTNFVYHYQKQDRNFQLIKTGMTKPLEEPDAPGWQKVWTSHRKSVAELVNKQIDALKTAMVEVPQTKATKSPEKKVDW